MGAAEGWSLPASRPSGPGTACLSASQSPRAGVPVRSSLRPPGPAQLTPRSPTHLPSRRLAAAPPQQQWMERELGSPGRCSMGATEPTHGGLEPMQQALSSAGSSLTREPVSLGRANAWVSWTHAPGSQGPCHPKRGTLSSANSQGQSAGDVHGGRVLSYSTRSQVYRLETKRESGPRALAYDVNDLSFNLTCC